MIDRTSTRRARGPALTALLGAGLFLVGTLLHPARDGAGIAEVGQLYGVTHGIQAIGLALQVVCLAALSMRWATAGRGGRRSWFLALSGTLAWFGLIVFDGNVNPTTARYEPDLVHMPADMTAGSALIVFPALVLFPLGHILLGRTLARHGERASGWLLAGGAVVYWLGGTAIFALGPHSPLIQLLEVVGAIPFALGFAMIGLRVARLGEPAAERASLASQE